MIGDRELLYPDTEELVCGTETLVAKGCKMRTDSTYDWREIGEQVRPHPPLGDDLGK